MIPLTIRIGISKSIGRDRIRRREMLETIREVTVRALGTRRSYRPEVKTRFSRPGAVSELVNDRSSTASSSGCAADANGTDCRKSLGTTAPFHGTFQPWVETGVLHRMWGALVEGCEPLDRRGLGMAVGMTARWARHALGGPDWTQPEGTWQGWYQAESPCRWRGRPLEGLRLRDANVHDAKLLEATLDAIVVERSQLY